MFLLPTGWALVDGAGAEGFEDGPHPPTYSYAVPRGWRAARRGIVVVKSGDSGWGRLHSPAPGSFFVVLQGATIWIERELTGLSPAHEYAVSFLAAYRTLGCGVHPTPCDGPAVLRLLVDGQETSGPIDLAPRFTRHEYKFVASTSTATIRFSNRGTAGGDRSAFLDAVAIQATGRHGSGIAESRLACRFFAVGSCTHIHLAVVTSPPSLVLPLLLSLPLPPMGFRT